MNRKAKWSAAAVGAVCACAIATFLTWPPYKGSSWELAYPPAWWQFSVLELTGWILVALPSYAVYRLDAFFASHEPLRNPFAAALITFEVGLLCMLTYYVVSLASVADQKASQAPS